MNEPSPLPDQRRGHGVHMIMLKEGLLEPMCDVVGGNITNLKAVMV